MEKRECAVCFNTCQNLISAEETTEDSVKWISLLKSCVPEVDWTLMKNHLLCSQCRDTLRMVNDFRSLCLRSFNTWFRKRTKRDDENQSYCVSSPQVKLKSEDENHYLESEHVETLFEEAASLGPFTCYHCNNPFDDKEILAEHITSTHSNRAKSCYVCEECGESHATFILLQQHRKSCAKLSKKLCDKCNECFDTAVRLKRHYKSVHAVKVPHKCEECSSNFNSRYLLNRHVSNVHAVEKSHGCDECGRQFASVFYLSAHKRYHTGDRPYICRYCGKGFITSSDLYHHEKIHANMRAYRCSQCPKAFNTSSDLYKHRICVHADRSQWKYVCSYCTRRFPLKTNLDSHTKIHTGERSFACHLCDRRCISRSVLTKHMLSHSNFRSFTCNVCKREYKHSRSLDLHVRKVHGEEGSTPRKFFCHLCPKAYHSNSKLQKHLRMHTGERPYPCDLCDKRFNDKSYVKQHMKTVHKAVSAEGAIEVKDLPERNSQSVTTEISCGL